MDSIKNLSYEEYLQSALTLNQQKRIGDCEYVAIRVARDFTVTKSAMLQHDKHRSTRQFWFIGESETMLIHHLPQRVFRDYTDASTSQHLLFLVSYSREDLPTSHIGCLWYSSKTRELTLLDPNGDPPFPVVHQFFEMYAHELKVRYIQPPRVNFNNFPGGYCSVVNMYMIYLISTGQCTPQNIHKEIIENSFPANFAKLERILHHRYA